MASVDMVKKKERVRRCPALCDKRLLRCVGVVMVIPFRTASCLPAAMTLPNGRVILGLSKTRLLFKSSRRDV